jgi:hypothetical protein
MKLAKGFLFALTGLFVMITLLSLLIPSRVLTAKSVTINAPRQLITGALVDFQQWKQWHPVFANNSINTIISKPSRGINANIEWGGAGKKNKMTITEANAEGIKLVFTRPGENPVENSIILLPLKDSGSYQVEWKALTRLKWYPWEKFAGIFVSEVTGPGYQTALDSLKIYVENHKPNPGN